MPDVGKSRHTSCRDVPHRAAARLVNRGTSLARIVIMPPLRSLIVGAVLALATSPGPSSTPQFVKVRHPPGTLHGFLVLRSPDGATIGDGDLLQTVANGHTTTRTVFRFHDGSIDDETAVYSTREVFRLTTFRQIQRGPMFEHPLTMDVDVASGKVVVHREDKDGGGKVDSRTMTLPPDLSNGLMITLLENVDAKDLPLTIPLLAATPDPRLVKLVVTNAGSTSFSTGRIKRPAIDYLIKTEIGGVAGLVAPIVGKQPPDAHVWILTGDVPAFIRSDAPLTGSGPVVRTELAVPDGPH
jgi:hypothetical protein